MVDLKLKAKQNITDVLSIILSQKMNYASKQSLNSNTFFKRL